MSSLKDLSSGKPNVNDLKELIKQESELFRIYPLYLPFIYYYDLPVEISDEIEGLISTEIDIEFAKISMRKLNKELKNILASEIYFAIKVIIQDELRLLWRCKEFITTEHCILGKYLKYDIDSENLSIIVDGINLLIDSHIRTVTFILTFWDISDESIKNNIIETLKDKNNELARARAELSIFQNPELKMFPKAVEYIKSLKFGDKPSKTGLAKFLGISRPSLYDLPTEEKNAIDLLFK